MRAAGRGKAADMRESGKRLWITLILPLLLVCSGLCLCPHPAAAAAAGAGVHAGHCADPADPGATDPDAPAAPEQGCPHCGEASAQASGVPAQAVSAPAPASWPLLAALLPQAPIVPHVPVRAIARSGAARAPARCAPSILLTTRALRL